MQSGTSVSATLDAVACCAALSASALTEDEAHATAELFKVLGDPTRVRIVNLIATTGGPVCACDFNDVLDLAQPTISHHLKKLTEAGSARARAARQVGLFLVEARRRREARGGRRSERSVLLMSTTADELREEVRRRYAESATRSWKARARPAAEAVPAVPRSTKARRSCSAGRSTTPASATRSPRPRPWPRSAVATRLAVAELREGETVLDLGSGGGIDVILSARRVGPTGTAFGLDMTDEMLALAQSNVVESGLTNVHLLKGVIEQIPLPAASVDVVISNCVINLSVDKPSVLAEIGRVLRPGGRDRDQRRRRRRPPLARAAVRARQLCRLHRGRALEG